MSSAKKPSSPADRVAHYDRIVATNPAVTRKGATVPYTSHNGNMFSYLDATGAMALRLPKEAREAFLTQYNTKLFEAHGIVQKEYVMVPDDLLASTEELRPYFEISYEYVQSLKPKPTKK